MTPYDRAERAAEWLAQRGEFSAAVVLGSGWSNASALGDVRDEWAIADIPGAPTPRVSGHSGTAMLVDVAGTNVVVLAGRSHLYEGHSVADVVHVVRSVVRGGASRVVLTNAAGAINPRLAVGAPVLLSDQINLTGVNPMCGDAPTAGWAGRFVDLSDLYSARLREAITAQHPAIGQGVYAAVVGGSYETPAEIRMLAAMGADLVGMSTVLEAIAARHAGAQVVGISLVTNAAAGLSSTALDHTEVLDVGRASSTQLVDVVRTAVSVS